MLLYHTYYKSHISGRHHQVLRRRERRKAARFCLRQVLRRRLREEVPPPEVPRRAGPDVRRQQGQVQVAVRSETGKLHAVGADDPC